ncbi:MAG: DUF2892 domain-containing protein [Thiotrichaceae bacterium]
MKINNILTRYDFFNIYGMMSVALISFERDNMQNVDGLDKGLRVVIGSILVMSATILYILYPEDWAKLGVFAYIFAIGGAIAMITGYAGFCPFYLPFGISSSHFNQKLAQQSQNDENS